MQRQPFIEEYLHSSSLLDRSTMVKEKRQKLDKDSQRFIDWSMSYLDNDWKYFLLALTALVGFIKYITQDRSIIKARLAEKFYIGGIEHGSPSKYSWEQVEHEVTFERDDLLGWPLVGKYSHRIDK